MFYTCLLYLKCAKFWTEAYHTHELCFVLLVDNAQVNTDLDTALKTDDSPTR